MTTMTLAEKEESLMPLSGYSVAVGQTSCSGQYTYAKLLKLTHLKHLVIVRFEAIQWKLFWLLKKNL